MPEVTRYKMLSESEAKNLDTGNTFSIHASAGEALSYREWLALGNTPDPSYPVPPPVIYKEKNSIILQLIAAGKMPAARAILSSPGMEDSRDLWDGAYKIAYDDASVRGLLTAVGMDAEDVMSRATTFGG